MPKLLKRKNNIKENSVKEVLIPEIYEPKPIEKQKVRKRINWNKIKKEYERGASQTSLAERFNVSQACISKKANSEGWILSPEERLYKLTTAKLHDLEGLIDDTNGSETSKRMDEEAERRAMLMVQHRMEPEALRKKLNFVLKKCTLRNNSHYNMVKIMKMGAETIKLLQDLEIRAWQLERGISDEEDDYKSLGQKIADCFDSFHDKLVIENTNLKLLEDGLDEN